ncbi:hypothetical protein EK21DRAFT_75042 [Setomelanomma holmii]|uniref:RING-type domain-containing protein n=1 Tax=Setomelanomma holmii TaxID=210430 RepID=A0A9P4H067_9PLEO|nr:hypothetical protein EK21DRAFT_75042 [Setomelanomma holmii]
MSTIVPSVTSLAPAASASQTQGSNSGGNQGGPTSSPLLFFVALGFGVVFTNLWIIVGVKYCFRYNRRRAVQAAADGEPIDLNAMPRPHRRRREKKLMTMDEVNERFPLTKYKQWKSTRETKGLPASGGIATAPASRAASMKDVEGVISAKDEGTSSPRPDTALSMAREDLAAPNSSSQPQSSSPRVSEDGKEKDVEEKLAAEKAAATTTTTTTKTETVESPKTTPQPVVREHDDESEDEDDPIRTATAPEMLAEPGDTCAICLDTLEDDDDVRGLTCGHAFHASCVDPWLTSRRACCPLCKADYYVPKPRPEGEVEQTQGGRVRVGLRSPTSPQAVWTTTRGNPFSRSRVIIVGNAAGQQQSQRVDRFGRLRGPSRQERAATGDGTQQTEQTTGNSGWRSRLTVNRAQGPTFSNWFGRNRNAAPTDSTPPQPTPGQLEAGNR